MSIEIKVPQLPESVSDATLVSWHKKVGDKVSRDENLVDLETDKVVLEVPAPADGTLESIEVEDGETVTAGQVIAKLAEGDAASADSAESDDKSDEPESEADAGEAAQDRQDEEETADDGNDRETAEQGRSSHKLSPSVRRLLDEHDIEATAISGSGKDGRITKSDVMSYLKKHGDDDVASGDADGAASGAPAAAERSEERVPMTRLRARIAERMVEAQQAAAMLTTFNEVDLTEVIALRSRYKESFEKAHDAKLGFMSFFSKASVEALRKFPVVNASVEGSDIVYHNYFDIGIAVSSDRGLLVPVLRDVDQMSFAEIESTIAELGRKAREGSIGMDELTGGTFTITNGGIFGSMLSTPILNPPQSAILGMHAIQQRPMAIDGEVVVRPMMYLALTYDHRII
ncbi:MAG: 2-oxoglutarate dehydrogenase complex dihydrolipoyllysine-residue succinyltransferase, partial [Woeseiaceae bacterium]|nr:2-oxoglutarate dehydrogenase complex dihydrolipoyllysine-residue succinyltransferase [Woeseiaceae bacterium]